MLSPRARLRFLSWIVLAASCGLLALSPSPGFATTPKLTGSQTTSPGIRFAKAPGLATAVDADGTSHIPDNSGPGPRPSACVSAWKTLAPAATRHWLGAFAPKPAMVKVNSAGNSRFCAVYVSLDRTHLLAAYLYVTAGRSSWKGFVASPPIADSSQFTGSLRADGSIRLN